MFCRLKNEPEEVYYTVSGLSGDQGLIPGSDDGSLAGKTLPHFFPIFSP